MARKPKESEANMVPLNVLIPADTHRRLVIAKANTRKSIKEMVAEWLEAGLAALPKDEPTPPAKPPRKPAKP